MQRVRAGALDAACIIVFVVIGRSSHAEGLTLGGVARTSWPFLVGAAVGWALSRAWRRPMDVVPTGIVVWVATVAVGMVLRVVAGQGAAAAFVAVASGFLGMEILGWRAVARVVAPRWVNRTAKDDADAPSHSRARRRPASGLSARDGPTFRRNSGNIRGSPWGGARLTRPARPAAGRHEAGPAARSPVGIGCRWTNPRWTRARGRHRGTGGS